MIYCGQQETQCLTEEATLAMSPKCSVIASSSKVPPRDPSVGLWTLSLSPLSFPPQFIMFPVVRSHIKRRSELFNHTKGSGKRSRPGHFYRTRRDSRQTPKPSLALSSTVIFLAFSVAFTHLLMSPVHQDWGCVLETIYVVCVRPSLDS